MEIVIFFLLTFICSAYIGFLLVDSKMSSPIFPRIRITLDGEAKHFVDRMEYDLKLILSYILNTYQYLNNLLLERPGSKSRKRVSAHLRKVVKQ